MLRFKDHMFKEFKSTMKEILLTNQTKLPKVDSLPPEEKCNLLKILDQFVQKMKEKKQ